MNTFVERQLRYFVFNILLLVRLILSRQIQLNVAAVTTPKSSRDQGFPSVRLQLHASLASEKLKL